MSPLCELQTLFLSLNNLVIEFLFLKEKEVKYDNHSI
jgi:hypothetical protein